MIFLVEDDDATRDAIRLMLECEGLVVSAFSSCDALCGSVDPKAADCLILDVHMRGMTGIDLLEQIRNEGGRQPIIMMTGLPTPGLEARAAAAGAFAVLEKPFKASYLIETVTRALAVGG